jgi:hypothetical protein
MSIEKIKLTAGILSEHSGRHFIAIFDLVQIRTVVVDEIMAV